jgi:hypothetical protein
MTKKLFQIVSFIIIASSFSLSAFAQQEIEIGAAASSSSSNGNSRTIEISRSGNYRLARNITVSSGDGIVISAANVSLNLGGYTVSTNTPGTGRGVFVNGVSGVSLRNGKIGGFNSNVMLNGAVNVVAESLQIVGRGLAPNNGPSEIGFLLINTRAALISNNVVTSVNLGLFVRGGGSTGNRIFENVISGGGNPANNLLGICYNPAANAGSEGPRGDNIYNNHISRFNYAIAISAGSVNNIFNENNLASFTGGLREPGTITTGGGTNIYDGNLEVVIAATVLP